MKTIAIAIWIICFLPVPIHVILMLNEEPLDSSLGFCTFIHYFEAYVLIYALAIPYFYMSHHNLCFIHFYWMPFTLKSKTELRNEQRDKIGEKNLCSFVYLDDYILHFARAVFIR